MLENLYLFAIATAGLAFSPGPDNIYVLSQAMAHGSRYGIATTAGLISGCIVHTTLLAFGVSAIITASPGLFWGIKIFGAAYLLFLAYKVYGSKGDIIADSGVPKKSLTQLYWQGVVMNLLNPKVILFFLAFFPSFLWNPDAGLVKQFYILGGSFMLISFLIFSSIALFAGQLNKYAMSHPKSGLFFKWLQIVVFVGIAIYILLPE
ncbi:LysE family translocator [Gilvibacter sp. SZ-19]|uniref:LysE family translocator n=1 Tax=unclassified Gilvibacter TaxID=2625242 RepID=UPI000B3C4A7F|nr:LysE family translocator [Gilvibacter sp. SZ-19]ARV12848.1 lysine transporter LysE [Gilvibacter sp. SZ-19]